MSLYFFDFSSDNFFINFIVCSVGVILVGLGSGIYLTANLGPGPRDGLMTGVQRITGKPIALVRGTIEVTVVFFGWLLGGTAGLGTVIFALGIGPAVAVGIYFVNKKQNTNSHISFPLCYHKIFSIIAAQIPIKFSSEQKNTNWSKDLWRKKIFQH